MNTISESVLNTTQPHEDFFSMIGEGDVMITLQQIKEVKDIRCDEFCQLYGPIFQERYGVHAYLLSRDYCLLTRNRVFQGLTCSEITPILLHRQPSGLLLEMDDEETPAAPSPYRGEPRRTTRVNDLRDAGLFESDLFLKEKILCGRRLSGRSRYTFQTCVDRTEITLSYLESEMDMMYESSKQILIVQAGSFNILKLYASFRIVYDAVKGKKEIMMLCILQKEEMIHIWKLSFEDPLMITSLREVSHHTFIYED